MDLIREMGSYLKALLVEGTERILIPFHVIGLLIFLFPSLKGSEELVAFRYAGGFILLVSTQIASFQLYRTMRPRLGIKAIWDTYPIALDSTSIDNPARNLRIDLTNRCRFALNVTEIGYKLKSIDELFSLRPWNVGDLPGKLAEADVYSVHVHRAYIDKPNEIEFLYAKDHFDWVHKSMKFPLRCQ